MNPCLTINAKGLRNYLLVSLLSIALMCSSCARQYLPVEPERLGYDNTQEKNGVTFSYQYSVLQNKYRNKEARKKIKLVAVKCTNNTERDLVFGTDIQLMREKGNQAEMAGESYIYSQLRQRPASHLWWMLFTFLNVYYTEPSAYGQTNTTTIPVGLVLGPALSITNISIAANANRAFRKELNQFNLLGRTIRKGETVYGVLGIREYAFEKLTLKDSLAH